MGTRADRRKGPRRLLTSLAGLVAICLPALALAGAAMASLGPRNAAASGDLLWSMRVGSSHTDALYDAARTSDGGVVAAGLSDSSVPGLYGDGLVVKYSATGTQQWAMAYDDGDDGYDVFTRVKVAADGGIVAAGEHMTGTSNVDLLVVKYDESGKRLWATSVHSGGAYNDRLGDMDIDPYGDVVVTGTAHTLGDDRLLVARLDGTTGGIEWSLATYGPGTGDAGGASCVVAMDGSAYVTGTTRVAGLPRVLVMRVQASGAVAWARTWGVKGTTSVGHSVWLDIKGRPFVLAEIQDASGFDVVLLRYRAAGTRVFVRRYGFAGGRDDLPADMAIDLAGRVFICGRSDSPGGAAQAGFVLSYSASGTQRFAKLFPRTDPRDTSFSGVLPDHAGGAYVCGGVGEPQAYRHRLMVHYTSTGGRAWSRSVTNMTTAGDDEYAALAPCGNEDVTAVGWYRYAANDYDGIADTYRR
jgi:hypothetical protein